MQIPPSAFKKTRRVGDGPGPGPGQAQELGMNSELENFLNLNASEAYKRPWHRLERGLRLNRLRKFVDKKAVTFRKKNANAAAATAAATAAQASN